MTLARTACLFFCVVTAPAAATGQPRTGAPPPAAATTVIERTYVAGDFAPWRRVQTRSVSGNREVLVDTVEVPDIEGRLGPTQTVVTETNRPAPNTLQTRRDVFWFSAPGRRQLMETTDSRRDTLANGDISTVHNTWVPDLNGRLGLRLRQIEQTQSAAAELRETRTSLMPSPDAMFRETERTEYTERRVDSGVVRYDSAHLIRDVNGRWQPIETRHGEVRETGATERVEDETISRPDINGNLTVDERIVFRRSTAGGQEQVVIETYAPYANGFSPNSSLTLVERVRRTTTATADGRRTVEEVEGANSVALNDPMQVIRRTVTTVRQVGQDRSLTEREVYERDLNGRLRIVTRDTEERTGR